MPWPEGNDETIAYLIPFWQHQPLLSLLEAMVKEDSLTAASADEFVRSLPRRGSQ